MPPEFIPSRRMTLHAVAALSGYAALLLSGCASAPPSPSESLSAFPKRSPRPPLLTDDQALEVSLLAMSLHGTPYRFGGNTPQGGFDCSGFIGYVYWNGARIRTPRTVKEIFAWAPASHQARSGELVFFGDVVPTHAGILVDQDRFIHAPSTGGTVRIDRLSSPYWARSRL